MQKEAGVAEYRGLTVKQETSLQEKLDKQLDIPYKLYGTKPDIPDKLSYMGERIFAEHRIPKEFVLNHLFKIYVGMIYSIANRDEEFILEYCEKNFAEKLCQRLKTLEDEGYIVE